MSKETTITLPNGMQVHVSNDGERVWMTIINDSGHILTGMKLTTGEADTLNSVSYSP